MTWACTHEKCLREPRCRVCCYCGAGLAPAEPQEGSSSAAKPTLEKSGVEAGGVPSCDSPELAAARAFFAPFKAVTPFNTNEAIDHAHALLRMVDELLEIVRGDEMLKWQLSYDELKAERDDLRAKLAETRQKYRELLDERAEFQRRAEIAEVLKTQAEAKLAEAERKLEREKCWEAAANAAEKKVDIAEARVRELESGWFNEQVARGNAEARVKQLELIVAALDAGIEPGV